MINCSQRFVSESVESRSNPFGAMLFQIVMIADMAKTVEVKLS